jgi:transcription antitermination protein NusB
MTDDHRDETTGQPGNGEPARTPDRPDGASRPRKRRSKRKNRPMAASGSVTATPTRHQSRILALQALYEYDLTGHDGEEIGTRLRDDEDFPPAVRDYAATVFNGVIKRLEEIDSVIGEAAPAFPVRQLAAVDRNVLRIAIYELMAQRKTVPVRVAINEAIEIAKNFGAENSGRFVHGVLGTVSRQFPDDTPPAAKA